MATADQETVITFFACPYLRCDSCGRRAVGMVGPMNQVVNLLSGLITVSLPSTGRNWPCYDMATRTAVCDNWTSTTGCQHPVEERAQHSTSFTFEGTRK
jgi:hypothetical protein